MTIIRNTVNSVSAAGALGFEWKYQVSPGTSYILPKRTTIMKFQEEPQ